MPTAPATAMVSACAAAIDIGGARPMVGPSSMAGFITRRHWGTRNLHGAGCTLAAAIAALLPALPVEAAVGRAKDYLTAALRASDELSVGHGHGPVHHFHALWQQS